MCTARLQCVAGHGRDTSLEIACSLLLSTALSLEMPTAVVMDFSSIGERVRSYKEHICGMQRAEGKNMSSMVLYA
jgi:hypothetical protein